MLFVLAIMLTYGSDFTIDQLPTVDRIATRPTSKPVSYPITIVNCKNFAGESEYIGRPMLGLRGSPLANRYKVLPHGPFTREESVLHLYRKWIWEEIKKKGAAYQELLRMSNLAREKELILSCWCAPQLCHGTIIKNAIEYLITLTRTLEARWRDPLRLLNRPLKMGRQPREPF